MEKKRPKRGKNSYLNDFHLNVAGEYIYDGVLYAFTGTDAERKTLRTRLWVLSGVLAAAAIAGGCIHAPGMQNCFYVMLPYMGMLCAAVSTAWAVVRLGSDWEAVREYVFARTVPCIPRRALTAAIFAALTILAETVYLFRSGSGGYGFSAACFYALQSVVLGSGLLIRRRFSRAVWDKVSKNRNE